MFNTEKLREKARLTSATSRFLAESKSGRQTDNPERHLDLYHWIKPEDTTEWKAAEYIDNIRVAFATYMSQFGQALDAHGIEYTPAQVKADKEAREILGSINGHSD